MKLYIYIIIIINNCAEHGQCAEKQLLRKDSAARQPVLL